MLKRKRNSQSSYYVYQSPGKRPQAIILLHFFFLLPSCTMAKTFQRATFELLPSYTWFICQRRFVFHRGMGNTYSFWILCLQLGKHKKILMCWLMSTAFKRFLFYWREKWKKEILLYKSIYFKYNVARKKKTHNHHHFFLLYIVTYTKFSKLMASWTSWFVRISSIWYTIIRWQFACDKN